MRSILLILAGLVFIAGSFFDSGASSERRTIIVKTRAGQVDTLHDVVPIDVKVCGDYPQGSDTVRMGLCYETRETMDQDRGVNHWWAFAIGAGLLAFGIWSLIRDRFADGSSAAPRDPAAPVKPVNVRSDGWWTCGACRRLNSPIVGACANCGVHRAVDK